MKDVIGELASFRFIPAITIPASIFRGVMCLYLNHQGYAYPVQLSYPLKCSVFIAWLSSRPIGRIRTCVPIHTQMGKIDGIG